MCLYLLIFALFTQWMSILSYDLCSNSRIDSIAYIGDTKQYFITSGGHYWLVKENEMPTKTGGKPMPDGWRGDGAAYINGLSNSCKDSSEQLVLVLEGNNYRLFDVRSLSWDEKNGKYNEYKKISHVKMNWGNKMDAIFDFNSFEIYAVQGEKYAASDWSGMCDGSKQFADNYDPNNARIDFETKKTIDAMMYVSGKGLFVFTGDEYYIMPLDMERSGKGKIQRASKSSIKSVRKDFFNCSGSSGPSNPGVEQPVGEKPNPDQQNNKEDEEKKGGGIMWIIIGVVLLIIVVAVIAFLVFMAMRRRKSPDADSGVSKSRSKGSSQSKGSSRSKASPSKFNQLAAKSTASSRRSKRSKIFA